MIRLFRVYPSDEYLVEVDLILNESTGLDEKMRPFKLVEVLDYEIISIDNKSPEDFTKDLQIIIKQAIEQKIRSEYENN